MSALYKKQKEALYAFQKMIASTSDLLKTGSIAELKNRQSELGNWWFEFECTNGEIQGQIDESQPYIVNSTFERTKAVYEEERERLITAIAKRSQTGESSTQDEQNDSSDDENVKPPKLQGSIIDIIDNLTPLEESTIKNPTEEANAGLTALRDQVVEISDILESINLMSDNASRGFVLAQIEILKQAWQEFRAKYNEERAKANSQLSCVDFKSLQRKYAQYYGKLNDLINPDKPVHVENVQLPKLKIPEFDGKVAEWPGFISLYDKIVHENATIDNGIKVQYLKSSLKNDALKIINHVQPTAANYDTCYKLLRNRYDNKRATLGKLLDTILLLPKQRFESSNDLKELHDTVNECILSIQNIGIKTKYWDPLLNHIILHKLAPETVKNYECQLSDVREPQTLAEFLSYIESRFLALQSAEAKTPNFRQESKKELKPFDKSSNFKKETKKTCLFCKADHKLRTCDEFLKLKVQQRIDWAKTNKLCNNCLSNSHKKSECNSKFSCQHCNKSHNSLLHIPAMSANLGHATCANVAFEASNVLLATALVKSRTRANELVLLRALLDQGSQCSFVTESTVQLLGLKKSKTAMQIFGIGGSPKMAKSFVRIALYPRFDSTYCLELNAIVLDKLTSIQFNTPNLNNFNHLHNLLLADPAIESRSKIELLLGAAEYNKILKSGLVKGQSNEPIAQNTEFGWVISGQIDDKPISEIHAHVLTLDEQLSKFFDTDDVKEQNALTEEEQFCEQHFIQTHKRDANGKYIVSLPFKNDTEPALGESRKIAIASLFQLEKRFERQPELKKEYVKFINEYIGLNHMTKIPYNSQEKSYYLPHHPVFKQSSTTKLRVVFNASQNTSNNVSLNDTLAIGNGHQRDMFSIVLSWRMHKYAIVSDIEKMYRQVWLNDEQCKFQKIVWRENKNDPIQDFMLRTITYGTANAPYLALRTLLQLSKDLENTKPQIAEIIRDNFYVDDCVSGVDTVEKAMQLYTELKESMLSGGFNLRKWSTNCLELKDHIPLSDREIAVDSIVKTLGISWNTDTDNLIFEISFAPELTPKSKRELLSQVSSLYDPLGLLAPMIIKAKILIQEIWTLKLNWDETLPAIIVQEWQQIKNELLMIKKFEFKRWVNTSTQSTIELHAFCDASAKAYAAVVYIKTIEGEKVSVSLFTSKYRVASIKTLTIPRLELSAAALLAKLVNKVLIATKINFNLIKLYTDSRIVLDWINGNPKRWTTFVQNKVININKNVSKEKWAHQQN